VQNDAPGISGGASKNRATRGSGATGATGGPVKEARQESSAARARTPEHGGSGWWAVFMNFDFE